ncbi:peroxidasin homolog [Sycon ciliatum]|uniref:peroxidasin homolog n=1 Tax=Sycon ciliatum TaxID=27933 RepID=UPI0020AB86B3|eukprot:scpid39928/ scgid31846/ Hemicentin-2
MEVRRELSLRYSVARALLCALLCSPMVCVPQTDAQATASPAVHQHAIDILIAYPEKPDHELIVVETAKPVTLVRGETYDLACHFQPEVSSDWQVTWQRQGNPVDNSSETYVSGWLGTVFEDYQLRFQNFSSDDAGFYHCQATDPSGATRQVSAIVQVVPEIVMMGLENGRVAELLGASTEITCSAKGYPPAAVTWQKNGVEVAASGSLVLTNVARSDNGSYECVATNNAGITQARADVVVVEKLAWIESPESQVTVQPNQPLTVTCKASGAPAPRIEWGRFTSHYQRLTELDGRTTFTLSPSEIRNGDSYICMARSTFICCPDKNVQTPIVAKFTVSVSTSVAPTFASQDTDCWQNADCSSADPLLHWRSSGLLTLVLSVVLLTGRCL